MSSSGFAQRTEQAALQATHVYSMPVKSTHQQPSGVSSFYTPLSSCFAMKRSVVLLRNWRVRMAQQGAHVFCWEKIYHEALSNYVKKRGLNKVGGKNERCPVDETAVGKVGRMVGKPASKKGSLVRAADRIRARRPCKTIWKPKAKAFPKAKPGSLPRTSAATSLLNGCGWLCKLERMVNSHAHTKMATKRWQWMFYLMLRKHPRGNPEVRNT